MPPPRMLPTDVVSAIDRELPWVKGLHTELGKAKQAEFKYRATQIVPGILRLIDRVPDELFAGLSSEDMTRFVIAETSLRDAIAVALNSSNNLEWPRLSDNVDCVAAIRTVLEKCPDQAPSESSKQLGFIKDKTFRTYARRRSRICGKSSSCGRVENGNGARCIGRRGTFTVGDSTAESF